MWISRAGRRSAPGGVRLAGRPRECAGRAVSFTLLRRRAEDVNAPGGGLSAGVEDRDAPAVGCVSGCRILSVRLNRPVAEVEEIGNASAYKHPAAARSDLTRVALRGRSGVN